MIQKHGYPKQRAIIELRLGVIVREEIIKKLVGLLRALSKVFLLPTSEKLV